MTEESKKEEASVGESQEERTVSDFERTFVILWNSRSVREDELNSNQEMLPRGNEDMPNTYSTERNMQNTIQGSSSQSFSMEGSVHQAAFTQGEVCSSATEHKNSQEEDEATPDINIRGRDDESSQPVHISGQKSGENGSKKMLEKKSDVHMGVTSGDDSMQGDVNINAGDSAQKILHGTVSAKETYVKSKLDVEVLQRLQSLWEVCTEEVSSGICPAMVENVNNAMRRIDEASHTFTESSMIVAFLLRLRAECFNRAHYAAELNNETKVGWKNSAIKSILEAVHLEPWSIEFHHFLVKVTYQSGATVDMNVIDHILELVDSGQEIDFIDPDVSLFHLNISDSKEERVRSCMLEYENLGKNEMGAVLFTFKTNKDVVGVLQSMESILSKYKISRHLRAMTFRFMSECCIKDFPALSVDYALRSAGILGDSIECCYWVCSLLSTTALPQEGWEQVLNICSEGLSFDAVDSMSAWMIKTASVISSNPRKTFSIKQYKDEFERIRALAEVNIVRYCDAMPEAGETVSEEPEEKPEEDVLEETVPMGEREPMFEVGSWEMFFALPHPLSQSEFEDFLASQEWD